MFGYGFYWFTNSVRTGALEVGVLLMFVSVIGYISTSMARVVEDSSLLYDSLLWIEKYFNFLEYHDDFENGRQEFPDEFKKIEVKDLSFTYPFSDDEVLHNVSFSVNSGEKIAIVGENGSGKSTLVKLLMRFYDPTTGAISIDDDNLKDFNIFDLHKNLSATFQDFSRFKLTLKENVITGYSFNKERVNNVLKAAGLENLLANDHLQLGTILAKDFENGTVKAKSLRNKQKAIFIDRDGTINQYIGFLRKPSEFELLPGVIEAIKRINNSGYLAIVITNQPVIARGEVTVSQLQQIHNKMETILGDGGAYLDAIYYCPHHPDKGFEGEIPELKVQCNCRKPRPGMLLQAADEFNLDLENSWIVGDSCCDMEAGRAAGCKTAIIGTSDPLSVQVTSLFDFVDKYL